MSEFKFPPKEDLFAVVKDLRKPVAQRMRAIFYLRSMGGDDAVENLCAALANKEGTTLFRHEIAYVLGQMQAKAAVPTLLSVLRDESDDPIVRHESGEALGAIADPATVADLEHFANDARPEVAETCQIALKRVKWALENGVDTARAAEGHLDENPFESVDPAPAEKKPTNADIPKYREALLNPALPLFERYKAMFSLRNNGSRGAVLALCEGLKDASPLFRHEVAYVLGQLASPDSITALKASVLDPAEHEMVRHEAAEALGAVGTMECVEFLQQYVESPAEMLRESCVVALDCVDYWNQFTAPAEEGEGGSAAEEAKA